MTTYILAFLASFFFIFLKAIQQQNITHAKYSWMVPTSMLMAGVELYVVATIAKSGYGWVALAVGLGAGFGAVVATWIHSKYII